MLVLAASKGNYFQWIPEDDVVIKSPVRGQIMENISNSTEFPSAAEF